MPQSPPETRASLILRLQNADDVAAWEEFAQFYGPVISRVAQQRGFQTADAENLIQEVWMAVAKSLSQWLERADRGSFRAWLLRIAQNEAVMETLNQLIADGELSISTQFSTAVRRNFAGDEYQYRLSYPIAADPGVGGQTVTIDLNSDGTMDAMAVSRFDDPSTAIDESGNFEFVDVPVGTHVVEFQSEEYEVTLVGGEQQSATVQSGLSVRNVDFAVRALPNGAPRVVGVWASSTEWPDAFFDNIGDPRGFPLVGDDQLRSLPWASGIDILTVQFSEDVSGSLDIDKLVLRGSDQSSLIQANSLSYDSMNSTLSISLLSTVTNDRLMLSVFDSVTDENGQSLDGEWIDAVSEISGDGSPGGQFDFRFNILAGDITNDGVVNLTGDVFGLLPRLAQPIQTREDNYFDVNADSVISLTGDLFSAFGFNSSFLPAFGPPAPTPLNQEAVDATFGMYDEESEIHPDEWMYPTESPYGLF